MSSTHIPFFMELLHTVKMFHWNTKSYARHKATDELHTALQSLVDKYVEISLAKSRTSLPKSMKLEIMTLSDPAMVNKLDEASLYIEQKIKPKEDELKNIRDEILATIKSCMYLFSMA
jgi:DNA-binding ferritin-like protein